MVDALLRLADAEVATKKGISGTMLKTAYSGAKKASAGSVRKGIDRLLPEIAGPWTGTSRPKVTSPSAPWLGLMYALSLRWHLD